MPGSDLAKRRSLNLAEIGRVLATRVEITTGGRV
jgi:hypothetical protein